MMSNDPRLAELFSLASKMEVYGALARRVAETQRPVERDISSYSDTLKQSNNERNVDREVLHYSYGL